MKKIDRRQVQNMIGDNHTTLVEVLEKDQYDKFHLPGAINVPLADDFDTAIQKAAPNKFEPIVVYCMDENCDASPKAAKRLDELGYEQVFDYEAGKMDWKTAGLPIES